MCVWGGGGVKESGELNLKEVTLGVCVGGGWYTNVCVHVCHHVVFNDRGQDTVIF